MKMKNRPKKKKKKNKKKTKKRTERARFLIPQFNQFLTRGCV